MLAVASRARACALLVLAAVVFLAAPAFATTLGLQPGDLITSIEWSAINGGTFTVPNDFDIDGAVDSVNVTGPTTYPQVNVSMTASLSLTSESINFLAAPIVQVNVIFDSPGLNPDVVIQENGINILLGNFTSSVRATGNLNLNDTEAVFTAIGTISIIGGDAALVAALGGMGGTANLLLTASIFDFNPPPNVLLADNVLFNSNLNLSLSGTLIPLSSSPFVPEPSTALLFGGGLVGLLGMARRSATAGRD